MDAEYLNLYVLQNSIGLVVCGLLGAGLTWLVGLFVKEDREDESLPAVTVLTLFALVLFGVSGTCGYQVAKAYVAPQTVLSERATK